ncbi:TPA: 50S ribosomal protein L9 [candidate division CPR2 bacterium]|uniref:Large ribosomal subunit protein bL9 n=1 Tax=candidate division CPR2 bacterium GW2011_GWC1_41_48 TaxID=1618344 RepID=A0A0G0WCG4_UNCC2|nr:MAG: 50S ribosomal protein L9 [candidate division CPR2 bacterium GW2011_GWC2_39_35]KKR29427.1 MAG: 50S ribosomal protein L9 [candidate division CPR2 bacterium GW2011_GWD2_39_7]KKS09742.1 MAG: 50S ribosomal protein L9 [candidate division CPR2 bacterium GW2011_GWC1_41_48]OGB71248.1 MAG: 50S ribosomal protein L9 [candidate division CPR2 bacterium GWD2_39_7]HBG81539.1 50S ribosomal protein L9 [candidate division CPR2 bacterium]
MKVIVLKSVDSLKPGDIKEVADGYARNFLIQKGFAKVATEENIKKLQGQIEEAKKEEEKKADALTKKAAKIKGIEVEIPVKAGDEDKIFGSVTSKDIAEALAKKDFDVDKHNIIMEPIKKLGVYDVEIKFGNGVTATVKVNVTKEQ